MHTHNSFIILLLYGSGFPPHWWAVGCHTVGVPQSGARIWQRSRPTRSPSALVSNRSFLLTLFLFKNTMRRGKIDELYLLMTDVINLSKKAFTWSVVLLTILWSMGVSALVPLVANAAGDCLDLSQGDLVQFTGSKAVYVLNANLERLYFPRDEIFKTWYSDFSGVNVVPTSCVDTYTTPTKVPLGVSYRPGSMLVKTVLNSDVYVVEQGNVRRKLTSEAVASALYGATWTSKVRDVADEWWGNLTKASTDVTEAKPHNGMLVKTDGSSTVYSVQDGKLYMVDGDVTGWAQVVSQTVLDTLEVADTTVTKDSLTADPTQGGITETPGEEAATGGTVTVKLAGNTTPADYIAKGAYNAEFAKFTFKATTDLRVDEIELQRAGLGVDADITAVRLYDGVKQIGSDQALNTLTHKALFKNLNWDLKAGETKTLTVKADTATGASGTNDYFQVNSVALEGTGTVSGSFPLKGNAMQYHAVAVGGLDIDVLTAPGAKTIISGATEQELVAFSFVASSSEGVYLKSFGLTNTGTISDDKLCNFVVKDGATVVGKNTACLDSADVMIELDGNGLFIDKSKSKNLSVYADVGAEITLTTRTIILQMDDSKDVIAVGDDSKAQYVVTDDDWTSFDTEIGPTMTVDQGTLTVAHNTGTAPVASDLVYGVPDNKVAAFRFTAGSTEGMKVTRFRLTASGVDSADWSNFRLFTYDESTGKETQVGSPSSISGTTITFEDTADGLFDVAAGKYTIVHVYTDVSSAASYTQNSGSVYVGTGTNTNLLVKAKGVKSNDFVAAADITLSSVAQANAVVFGRATAGTLTVTLDSSTPSADSIAKGVTGRDFAHFKLQATGEDISVTQLIVNAYNSNGNTNSAASGTNDYSNVKLWDITDSANPVQLGTTATAGSTASTTFSFSLTVKKDSYKLVKVTADVPSNSDASYLNFRLDDGASLTSTGVASGTDVSETVSSADGNTMTVATPTVTVTWAAGATENVVTNASDQTLGTLQLTAGQFETIKVTSIKISADDATPVAGTSSADTDLTSLRLVGTDGTQYGVTKNLTTGTPDTATFDAISNLTVTKGQTKIIYIKAKIAGSSGTYYVGTAATTDIVATGLDSGNSATISGTGTGRANAIQSVANLSFALDPANPLTTIKAVGANGSTSEEEFLRLSVDTVYEDVNMTKLVFQLVGGDSSDVAHQAFDDNGIKLYHKVGSGSEKLIGSATAVSSTTNGLSTYYTATFNINSGDLMVSKTADDVVILKATLKGVDEGLTSGVSPLFRLGNNTAADDSLFVEARGVSSGTALDDGQFNASSALSLTGNQMKAYKAYPSFEYVSPGTTLVNGVENEIYKFKVTANGGNVGLKQLEFTIDIVDNVGTIDNSMAVHTFKLYRGDTNLTDSVKIHTASAVAEASLEDASSRFSAATGTGKLFYITWTGTNEEVVPSGTSYTYTIKATTAGFSTDADNDYVRVRLNNGQATTEIVLAAFGTQTTFLSPWGTGTGSVDFLTLDDGTLDSTLAATTSIIWSDRSSATTTNRATTGTYNDGVASGSGDWWNGYFLKEVPTNYSQLVR